MDRINTLLILRRATVADTCQLALFNQQLIQDEGHDNQASLIDLEQRMTRWLSGLYVVALFELDEVPVAFATWREDEDGVYLRQFFVAREQRRSGVGRAAFALLDLKWQGHTVKIYGAATGAGDERRIRRPRGWSSGPTALDALLHNERALNFYHALGFADYSLVLRRLPPRAAR